uniref:gliding motility-associated C-terminal domain-containing protein n=1 Tax=Flavobacterium sp. TaxID=239 RepID=UPI0026213BC8
GLVLNADGTVTINPNTPAGSYNVEYTICEITNPGNCDTVISIVTVTPAVIDAVTETYGPINSTTGGTTPPLTTNDTLNGNPVVIGTNPGQVVLTPVTVPSGLVLNADGTVTINPNTPAGSYNVEYTICEITNPGNCDTVISIVTVTPAVIDAVTETYGPINSTAGGTTPPLTTNDTLNGNPVVIGTNPGQVVLTPVTVPSGLVLNADGTVTVNPNTPAGSYNVEYTICEITNPGNCDTVISIVTVTPAVIDAVTDAQGPVNGTSGGTTPPLTNNDTLNGNPVVIGTNPGQVVLTPVNVPSGLVLNADGTVTVNAGTPAGDYNVEYTICEITNPGNCDTVISIITVIPGVILANDDAETVTSGSSGAVGIINIFENDTLDGNPTGLTEVTLTINVADPTNHITLNSDGTVDLAPGTPAGTYQITYTICEILNPGNCSTAVITVVVGTIDEIDIYTHMTPNGDGENDEFFIDGISKYPNNTVEIYNRWGVLVYHARGYNNKDVAFRGVSDGRTTVNTNDNLQEGTYYYVIKYTKDNGESKEKAAYLYINR